MAESRVIITGDAEQAVREFNRLRAQATGDLQQIAGQAGLLNAVFSNLGKVAAAAIGYFSFEGLVSGVNDSIDRLAALDDSAQKTGSSIIGSLSRLQKVAMMTGGDFSVVDKAVFNLAKSLGSTGSEADAVRRALGLVGVSANDIKTLDPAAIFIQTSKSLQNYKDGAGKSAAMNVIFKKSAEELLPFMNDVAEHVDRFTGRTTESAQAASAFQDNLGFMKVKASEFFDVLADNLVPSLAALTGDLAAGGGQVKTFAGYLQNLSDSGRLREWAETAAASVNYLVGALIPAAKLATAYFGIFVAAPAVFAAVAGAVGNLIGVIAVYSMNVLIGQAATLSWNKALWGTSIAADLAAGSLTKMRLAGSALFAAYAGWEIGKYLSDNFVEARLAGLTFVGLMLKGWENLKYAGEMLWEGHKFAGEKALNTLKSSFAEFLSVAAKGLALIGATDASNQVAQYAGSLKAAAAAQLSFSDRTKGMTAAHAAALDTIDQNIVELMQYQLAVKSVAAAKNAAAGGELAVVAAAAAGAAATKKEQDAYVGLVSSIGEKIAAGKLEMMGYDQLSESQKMTIQLDSAIKSGKIEETGWRADHVRKLIAERAAQERVIDSNKAYVEQAKAKLEATASAIKAAKDEADRNELLAKTFGMTKAAIEEMELARLKEQLAQIDSTKGHAAEIAELEALIDAKKRSAAAVGQVEAREVEKKFNEDRLSEQKKTVDEYSGIFRKGFADMINGGKGSWSAFTKSLTTTFKTTVADQIYDMFAKPFVVKLVASLLGVTGTGAAGMAQASGAGGSVAGATNMLQAGQALWSGFSGGFSSGLGTIATEFGKAVGSTYLQGVGGGATGAFAGPMADGTSLAASTPGASAGSSLGMVGGIAAVIAVAMMVNDKMYGSGWRTANGNNTGGVGKMLNLGMPTNGAARMLSPAGLVNYSDGLMQKLGLSARTASLLSGSSLMARAFGNKNPETTSKGITGEFDATGFSGETFVNWLSKGGWFASDKSGKQTGAVDSATASQFSGAYAGLTASAKSAAGALGLSSDVIAKYSEKVSVTLTDDAEKNAEAIAKLFGDISNNLATAVAPGITGFVRDGEAAGEALARLSGSITVANGWLSILRQRLFQVSLAGGDAASKLADTFGGLENLSAASKSFFELYYTEGDRVARSQQEMAEALAKVNLAMPTTKDGLRELAGSLDLNTEAGRKAYATLLALGPEFSSTAEASARLAKETAAKLMATFTGNGKLMPALSALDARTGTLVSSFGKTGSSAGVFSSGLSNGLYKSLSGAQIKTLALATGFSEAQIRAGALTRATGKLGLSIDASKLSAAALATGMSASRISALALASANGTLTTKLTATEVRALSLATGFSEAQVQAGALARATGRLGLSIDASKLSTAALATGMSKSQIRALALASANGTLAYNLSRTEVRALALATGFSETQIRAGALTRAAGRLGLSIDASKLSAAALATGMSKSQIRALALASANGTLAYNLSRTEVRALALATGLSEAQVRAGALTKATGAISAAFLDANSGLITFNSNAEDLKPIFTGAQLAGILLNDEIDDLRLAAGRTAIDIEGLGDALAGVNTETFVATIGLVFESLATRIQGVVDAIGAERVSLREAALQIINPTVMSRAAIKRGIAGVNTVLPGNGGIASAQQRLSAADALVAQRLSAQAGALAGYTGAKSAADSARAQAAAAVTASESRIKDLYNQHYNISGTYGLDKLLSGAVTSQNVSVRSVHTGNEVPTTETLRKALVALESARAAEAAQVASAAAGQAGLNSLLTAYNNAVGATTSAQNAAATAVQNAKNAQLAYVSAIQNFSIDASKSVGKLGKLREETVKYYEAQKQLADLMATSAGGLRGAVADYRYSQLTDSQQLNKLQSDYAKTYALGLSTNGEALAGYGDKLSGQLGPLLEKAKEVMSDSTYSAFEKTTLARAEAIAGRLEALTPKNYAADSLVMLGQIDATLAALDASSKSAEKIISDAIKAGSDRTADGLRAVIAALTGKPVQAFATGGAFTNGVVSRPTAFNTAVMGEAGSEAIMPLTNINGSLGVRTTGGTNTARLEALVERQTQELSNMRAELRAIATTNAKMARLADRNDSEGMLVRTDADTPLATVAA